MGLVAPRHMGSFWIWDQTYVFCIGRWILHHWVTWGCLTGMQLVASPNVSGELRKDGKYVLFVLLLTFNLVQRFCITQIQVWPLLISEAARSWSTGCGDRTASSFIHQVLCPLFPIIFISCSAAKSRPALCNSMDCNAAPWTAEHQASLPFTTISWSLA